MPQVPQIELLRAFAGKAFTTFDAGFAPTFTSFSWWVADTSWLCLGDRCPC